MANQVYYVTTENSLNESGSFVKDYGTKQFDDSFKIFIETNDLQKWYKYPTKFWINQDKTYLSPNIPIDQTQQRIDELESQLNDANKQLNVAKSSILALQRQGVLNSNK